MRGRDTGEEMKIYQHYNQHFISKSQEQQLQHHLKQRSISGPSNTPTAT